MTSLSTWSKSQRKTGRSATALPNTRAERLLFFQRLALQSMDF
jgi:hypothetical protein